LTDRADESHFLGNRSESRGLNRASTGQFPAYERLAAYDAPRAHIDAGLIEKLQLLAVDRATQVGFELEPLLHDAVELVGGASDGPAGEPEERARIDAQRGAPFGWARS
jgi:hypothetical protein